MFFLRLLEGETTTFSTNSTVTRITLEVEPLSIYTRAVIIVASTSSSMFIFIMVILSLFIVGVCFCRCRKREQPSSSYPEPLYEEIICTNKHDEDASKIQAKGAKEIELQSNAAYVSIMTMS